LLLIAFIYEVFKCKLLQKQIIIHLETFLNLKKLRKQEQSPEIVKIQKDNNDPKDEESAKIKTIPHNNIIIHKSKNL
jgi:hypothetical protein